VPTSHGGCAGTVVLEENLVVSGRTEWHVDVRSVLLSVSLFGLTASDPAMALLTSDSTSKDSAIPVQRHAVRSPRVLRTRRIYGTAFRTCIGLCIFSPAQPAVTPLIRFLFVAPALCFGLPSDPVPDDAQEKGGPDGPSEVG